MIFGTPHYMSPEQGHGEADRCAQRSLQPGRGLYEMLIGREALHWRDPMAIVICTASVPSCPRSRRSSRVYEGMLGGCSRNRQPSDSSLAREVAASDR